MPQSCAFILNHPNAVYYSGDELKGEIYLTTDKVKKVRAVYITIEGVAKVRWTESHSRYNSYTTKTEYYTVVYQNERRYLYSKTCVEGSKNLQPGRHEYSFSKQLPQRLPSTIVSQYGHVTYRVKLKLDLPWRFDDVYEKSFTVIRRVSLLDLNPSYFRPVVDEEEKHLCCCCCASGPINSVLSIESGCYAPGQNIQFKVTLDNESDRDIDKCSVEIVQLISFRSDLPQSKTRTKKEKCARVTLEGAKRFSKKLHKGSVRIPLLPPSASGWDDIIEVSYSLRAEINTGWFNKNVVLHAGFLLGTDPIPVNAENPNTIITVQPTAPIHDMDDIAKGHMPPPQKKSDLIPLFEEAIKKPLIDVSVTKYQGYNTFASPSAPKTQGTHLTKEAESRQSLLASQATAPPPPSEDWPTIAEEISTSSLLVVTQPSANMSDLSLPYPAQGLSAMPVPGTATRVNNSSVEYEG